MSALINLFIDYKMLSLHCERPAIALGHVEADIEHAVDLRSWCRSSNWSMSASYSDSEPWVLRNVSLVIEQAESVAIASA